MMCSPTLHPMQSRISRNGKAIFISLCNLQLLPGADKPMATHSKRSAHYIIYTMNIVGYCVPSSRDTQGGPLASYNSPVLVGMI